LNNIEISKFMQPFITPFIKKNSDELKSELIKIRHQFKLLCYDFPKLKNNDLNYLRKLILLLKIINRILEKAFHSTNFNFSWEDILINLLHLDNSPDLMISSMLRELKRKRSYNFQLLYKKENKDIYENYFSNFNGMKQKKILDYLF